MTVFRRSPSAFASFRVTRTWTVAEQASSQVTLTGTRPLLTILARFRDPSRIVPFGAVRCGRRDHARRFGVRRSRPPGPRRRHSRPQRGADVAAGGRVGRRVRPADRDAAAAARVAPPPAVRERRGAVPDRRSWSSQGSPPSSRPPAAADRSRRRIGSDHQSVVGTHVERAVVEDHGLRGCARRERRRERTEDESRLRRSWPAGWRGRTSRVEREARKQKPPLARRDLGNPDAGGLVDQASHREDVVEGISLPGRRRGLRRRAAARGGRDGEVPGHCGVARDERMTLMVRPG